MEILEGLANYLQRLNFLSDWKIYTAEGALWCDHDGLRIAVDIPCELGTDPEVVLSVTAWPDYKGSHRSHTWIYSERFNPQFVNNRTAILTDEQFTSVCQLLSEVSDVLLKSFFAKEQITHGSSNI